MAQTFWSDVTGKKITVGNLVSALPAYFYSTSSIVKVGGSTEYLSASSTSPSAALTFTAPSNSSATVTVGVKGKFYDKIDYGNMLKAIPIIMYRLEKRKNDSQSCYG